MDRLQTFATWRQCFG